VYLFDASSIVNLIKKGLAKVFLHGVTTDLALYESLNAVWKEFKLMKRIDEETALEYVDVIAKVFRAIKKVGIEDCEKEVFKVASRDDLTIYDAAYLYLAIKGKLTLVTDDQILKDRASKYVKVMSSDELARKYIGT